MPPSKPLAIHLWSHVSIGDADDCWLWTAARFSKWYGMFQRLGKKRLAHRVAFFLACGWWPEVVRHACDNPPCCNPKHLLGGTQKDNIRDMDGRGRGKRAAPPRLIGERNTQAKLTENAVRHIRASKDTLRSMADKYGVSVSAIDQVRARTTWGHVK